MKSPVTAVGRILKPTHGEPRLHHVIKIRPDGTVQTIIKRTFTNG